MKYRIGLPGWKLAARLGVVLTLRVSIDHDEEHGYFVTWSDLPDLRAEAKTMRALKREITECATLLIEGCPKVMIELVVV